jgi:hypothetical protein
VFLLGELLFPDNPPVGEVSMRGETLSSENISDGPEINKEEKK